MQLTLLIAGFMTSVSALSGTMPAIGGTSMVADTSCVVMSANVEGRRSPLDSLTFLLEGHPVKLCYGRPSARGRTMIGGSSVPYGELWRTGANEPTMLHTTVPLRIAGVPVDPGSYSLYTVPGPSEWQIVVNGSTSQWGHERNYTGEVAAQEIGRGTVSSQRLDDHVETFTIRADPAEDGAVSLLLEWEHTRVRVPIQRGS